MLALNRTTGHLALTFAVLALHQRTVGITRSLLRVRARITTGFEGCCIPPSRVARLLKPVRLRPPRSLLDGRISALRPA